MSPWTNLAYLIIHRCYFLPCNNPAFHSAGSGTSVHDAVSTTEVSIAGSPSVRASSSAGGSADSGLEVPMFILVSCDGSQLMQQLEFSVMLVDYLLHLVWQHLHQAHLHSGVGLFASSSNDGVTVT